ncbi:MAG: hypothetical protein M3R24_36830 [Chloroflexota bacterium]|nr:hypothetical protein [Chloroflexota bacterium]
MIADPLTPPTGYFQCQTCFSYWQGSELSLLQLFTSTVWACGNAQCGGEIVPVASGKTTPHTLSAAVRPSGPGFWRRRPTDDP